MFGKGKKAGTLRFSLRLPGGAGNARVAGSFNQWKPVPMRKRADGSFAVTLAVPAGTHEYKFVVDGQWITDPDNSSYAANPFGTVNSVAQAA